MLAKNVWPIAMDTKKEALYVPGEKDAYDAVAYPSFPYPDTHPDRLAAMVILHGLSPAPVERCRVLEIACNEGANLIPMAYAIRGSEFVGFDLARLPIERGQAGIRELALTNVCACSLSFAEIEPALTASGLAHEGALNSEGATLLNASDCCEDDRAACLEGSGSGGDFRAAPGQRQRTSGSSHSRASTTLLHTTLRLDDPIVRNFLSLLDGTRDRGAIRDALKAEFPAIPPEQLERGIEPSLNLLHRAGLLEA